MDSTKFNPKLKYKTRKGRIVYGGGGIMPDQFVPVDQTKMSESYKQLINSTLLIEFCFNYSNENKSNIIGKYPKANTYVSQFVVNDNIVNQYIAFFSNKSNVKLAPLSSLEKIKIRYWLKALIGRNIYQDEAFYPVLNKEDAIVQKALKIK